MEKRVVCPLLSLSWVFPLSNMETDVVHAVQNEEPFPCHGLHDALIWLSIVLKGTLSSG